MLALRKTGCDPERSSTRFDVGSFTRGEDPLERIVGKSLSWCGTSLREWVAHYHSVLRFETDAVFDPSADPLFTTKVALRVGDWDANYFSSSSLGVEDAGRSVLKDQPGAGIEVQGGKLTLMLEPKSVTVVAVEQ